MLNFFFLTNVSNYCEERKINLLINVYIKISRNLEIKVATFFDFWQFFSNFLTFQWATFQHFTRTIGKGLPLIGSATKWRQLCQPVRVKTYSSLREMAGQNQPQLPETFPYSQQRESIVGEEHVTWRKFPYTIVLTSSQITRISDFLIKENQDLFAMVLESTI